MLRSGRSVFARKPSDGFLANTDLPDRSIQSPEPMALAVRKWSPNGSIGRQSGPSQTDRGLAAAGPAPARQSTGAVLGPLCAMPTAPDQRPRIDRLGPWRAWQKYAMPTAPDQRPPPIGQVYRPVFTAIGSV